MSNTSTPIIPDAILHLSDDDAEKLTDLVQYSPSIILIVQRSDSLKIVGATLKSVASYITVIFAGIYVGRDVIIDFIGAIL